MQQYNEDWKRVVIDPDLTECALRFADLGAQWETTPKKGAPRIYGEFRLVNFHEVVTQAEGAPATVPDPTEIQQRFLSQLRVIDHTPISGSGKLTYIRMSPEVSPLEIWYSAIADIGAEPYPPGYLRMNITYREYLDALILTKGTYGWQYLYSDISLRRGDFRETVHYLQGMLDLFPEIFPQHDYTELRDRLEARL
ncbi:hypothetical protein ACFU7T_30215 [Streptomyces sp. NPDC057555]|uniref:hypothetical protein n=1 Tax=Streptomyces sp. NPDC057555 TaxID=3346166 RepID=UPI00368C618C